MVIIATDSAADFELDELKEMNITCLPMSVSFGENTYLENISITKDEFFERIETDKNFPKTSQPSPALFEELFTKAKENHDEVVYIPLSSGISGDYQTAVMAKNLVDYEGIWIIDSLTCTGGQRLLIEEAVRMRDAGADGETIFHAIEELKKHNDEFEYKVEWGSDLQTEHERYLTEQVFKRPVFVTDYPKEIKAFYMRLNDDGKTVAAVDCLVPGIGEIIGGSQREERLDVLTARIQELGLNEKDYWWYTELRKFGGVTHAGFGLGFERLVMYATGIDNIRDVIPFPRTTGNAEF